ncbi:hypothetical protein FKM82_001620 [Ascaphus truei]
MVFFTCNTCGESLKKGQVEKHTAKCRSCECFSCIDCGKVFWGDEYKSHLKCISEDQKYGGKDYEAKANKGDVKQQQWIQIIQDLTKKPGISSNIQNILNQISSYDNIPRKKAKFQNWMKNSLKIHNKVLQDQVWEIFAEATSSGTGNKDKPQQAKPSAPENDSEPPVAVEEKDKKKSKRERKEERQKHKKKEKKELISEDQLVNGGKKKGKKRKMEDEAGDEFTKEKKKKKKKKKRGDESEVESIVQNGQIETDEIEGAAQTVKKRKHNNSEGETAAKQRKCKNKENSAEENGESNKTVKGKFNWKGTIKALLKQAPDHELPIKKLRKKVLAQYYTISTKQHKSEAELLGVFNQKINKNPKFRVLKEKVKLLN